MSATQKTENLLYTDAAWTFADLQRAYEACEEIGLNDLGLNVYTNQIEVITSEQMLDATDVQALVLWQAFRPGPDELPEGVHRPCL